MTVPELIILIEGTPANYPVVIPANQKAELLNELRAIVQALEDALDDTLPFEILEKRIDESIAKSEVTK